jgi:rubrerythrin
MTDTKKALAEALKDALMVEIKGRQLYQHAAAEAKSPGVKELFQQLADDEEQHFAILNEQLESLTKNGKLDVAALEQTEVDKGARTVVTDDFVKSLKAGEFEMAVIGIGSDLEARAVSYYRERAGAVDDPDLKTLFRKLEKWEVVHLDQLEKLEALYKEAYWAERGYSPM